jgi:hypothetical protein
VVIDRDALMGESVDAGDFGGEGRIGQMPEGQSLAFDERTHDV